VFGLVIGAMCVAIVRRRRATTERPREKMLTIAVSGATAITVVILFVLLTASVVASRRLAAPAVPAVVTVDAIGHQWWWEFRYQDTVSSQWVTSPNELHVPVGVPIVVNTHSYDVIHSFWVPNLLGKRDQIPGYTTST